MIYNVEWRDRHGLRGTLPVEAESRREAVNVVKGRLGPETEAYVIGVRS